MDAVDRILSFIDNENETEEPEQGPEQGPVQGPVQAPVQQQGQAPPEAQNVERPEPQTQPQPTNNSNYDYTRDEKQYKSMLRKFKRLLREEYMYFDIL